MPRQTFLPFLPILLLIFLARPATGQITAVTPRACKPGSTTELTLIGKDLDDSLRIVSSSSGCELNVRSVEPTKAVVELTLPHDQPFGPLGLWPATSAGPLPPQILIGRRFRSAARQR